MKALCIVLAVAALVAPASAGEVASISGPKSGEMPIPLLDDGSQSEALKGYDVKNAVLTTTSPDDDATRALIAPGVDAQDALFAEKLHALIALAKQRAREAIRRAGLQPRDVKVRLRVRCFEKAVVMERKEATSITPATMWSGQIPLPPATTKTEVEKTCAFKLSVRRRAAGDDAKMRDFKVTLPTLEPTE